MPKLKLALVIKLNVTTTIPAEAVERGKYPKFTAPWYQGVSQTKMPTPPIDTHNGGLSGTIQRVGPLMLDSKGGIYVSASEMMQSGAIGEVKKAIELLPALWEWGLAYTGLENLDTKFQFDRYGCMMELYAKDKILGQTKSPGCPGSY